MCEEPIQFALYLKLGPLHLVFLFNLKKSNVLLVVKGKKVLL